MEEKQRFQEFELSDSVVGCSCSLLSFFTKDANANMSSQDHCNIVGTITNCKGSFFWMLESDQSDNVSFLLW